MINIAQPSVGDEEIEAVVQVMHSGMLAQGDVTCEFEKRFAEYCNIPHAVGVNSGTAALHMGLLALGIQPGDEVIVPSFTFIATASAVSMCGAKPVIVDVKNDTYTIDPNEISKNITGKTKAVIGVHLFGHPFDIDPVVEICDDNNLLLVEDAAQAHGAEYKGKKVGGFGKIGCFSFYPTKNMTTGEGGMVTTSDNNIDQKLRRLINHGQGKKYLHTELGYNTRMTNISAAIGNVQLGKLDLMNERRAENAEVYNKCISAEGIILPFCRNDSKHVWHQYVIEIDEDFPLDRNELAKYIKDHGIGTAVHYPVPVHMQPLYSGNNFSCPKSVRLATRVLSLPVHPGVSTTDCRYISRVINEVN